MKLLLDTHIWIWSLLEPKRLVPRVRKELASSGSEIWLSSISIWEVLLLVERDRLQLDRPAPEWLDDALARVPMREAPITYEIARQSRDLDLTHQDPADRVLAATALTLDLTLVTADDRLLRSKRVKLLANR
jgi:PIN domain nuclease of toxin-antitoxin system